MRILATAGAALLLSGAACRSDRLTTTGPDLAPAHSSLVGAGQAEGMGQAEGIVESIVKAPVSPDGLVAGRPTEFVINFDTSLDPAVPGRTLLKGHTIKVTLPEAFVPDGRPIKTFPCGITLPASDPAACNSVALLQGWPQNPIAFSNYPLSYEGTRTIVITALADLGPVDQQNPGIKQVHLIIRGFTNPGPGRYKIEVEAESGPLGATEHGAGYVHILRHDAPNINVVTAVPDNPPPRKNKIYQTTTVNTLALPMDFLLWDRHGAPFAGVEIAGGDNLQLVQNGRAVGHVSIDAPKGATGQMAFTTSPSIVSDAPVTGFPAGLLRVFFRTGSATGQYVITFSLNGGNHVQMFITAK